MTQLFTGHSAIEEAPRDLPQEPVSWQRLCIRLLMVADIVSCALALLTAAVVSPGPSHGGPGLLLLWFYGPVWLAVLGLGRVYDMGFLGVGSEEFRRIGRAGLRMLAIIAVVGLGFKLGTPRSLVAIVIPWTVGLSILSRVAAHAVLRSERRRGRAQHGVVVVGRPVSAVGLVARLQEMPSRPFRIAQVCAAEGLTVDEVLQAVREGRADTVAVASDSGLSDQELRLLGWELEGSSVDLIVSTDLIEVAGPRVHVRPMAGLPLLHVEQPELTGARRIFKESYDRVGALLLLLCISPLLIGLAIAVRLTSPGPALFKQTRVGRGGKLFTVLKFRSMRQGAETEQADLAEHNEADGPLFKMKADPRVTPLGRWMRRFSLDEFPQLLNILRGDMSLVGPRPPIPSEVEVYGHAVQRRLLVKPGLTGLWQVSGRSDLTWDQSVRLDLSYVENWSPGLDLLIMAKTVGAVLRRRGAY